MYKRILLWRIALIVAVLVPWVAGRSGAQVLSTGSSTVPSISYQAQITGKDGTPLSGEHTVTITLYTDAIGTQSIWTSTTKTMVAEGGILNASLGTADNPLPPPSAMDRPLWVGVSVHGTPELRPLATFSAAPLALNVADNAITANKLAPNAVTADKISADYVGSISVNGEKVTKKGGDLNIVTGDGVRSTYVSTSNTLVLSGAANATDGKVQFVATDPCSTNSDGTLATNTVSGGCANTIMGVTGHTPIDYSVVAGGQGNTISNVVDPGSPRQNGPDEGTNWHLISGGLANSIVVDVLHAAPEQTFYGASSIVGGQENILSSPWGFIGGGESNEISGHIPPWDDDLGDRMMWSSIVGGGSNTISQGASYAFIGGGVSNSIHGVATWVGGVGSITSTADHAFIGGGNSNEVSNSASTIAGGWLNVASGHISSILGGDHNTAAGEGSSVAGGTTNTANGQYSSVAGGNSNYAERLAFVGGGYQNSANSQNSAIVGGSDLIASGQAEIVGGWLNISSGGNHVLTSGPNDDRILELGSPYFDGSNWIAHNAFDVSYNGHSVVYHTNGQSLGGSPKVYQGATYVESPVYAWGAIDGAGNVIGSSSFGITQPAYLGLGTYMITLVPADANGGPQPSLADASVTVTVLNDDITDITVAPPPPPQGGSLSALSPANLRSVSDSAAVALFGTPTALVTVVGGGSSSASGSTAPLLPNVCGYATASRIGVLVSTFGSAYANSFIVRTYTSGGEQCQKGDLSFFFKVCHR